MWFRLDRRSTSWGKFSSHFTPPESGSLISWQPTMALYALVGHINMSFPVWTEPFKLSNRGQLGSQEAAERELCIDWRGCCQQRRAFCPDTWPVHFRVVSREPTWRLARVPAVFHMTSNTSHSSALISQRPFPPGLWVAPADVTSDRVSPTARALSVCHVRLMCEHEPGEGLVSTAESWGLMETPGEWSEGS